MARAVRWTERSISSGVTSASTRTRDSGSSVTVVFTASGHRGATIASGSVTRLSLPLRVRVAAWVVTGPVGHLWAGVVDWAALRGALLVGAGARARAAWLE